MFILRLSNVEKCYQEFQKGGIMTIKTVLFVLIMLVSMLGCMHTNGVPYVISEPECKVGKIEDEHDFAGVHFNFYNNSEKRVHTFNFSFIVFDDSGEHSPLIGSNVISARYMQVIDSKETHAIVFNLDPYIHQVPLEPFIIDFFYISKIEYDDGSVWSDPYGSWMPGSL